MNLFKQIVFDVKGDGRGDLIALESLNNIPFDIKRVYYLTNLKSDAPRGFHAHRNLKQVMLCLSGSCRVVFDDGSVREEVLLDTPNKGIFIGDMIWREMHDFSKDCVLMVIASEHYDESDYIRSYADFLEAKIKV